MARNTHGGGANTNLHGLQFEQETSLEAAFRENNYSIVDCKVSYFNQERIKNSKVKKYIILIINW